MIAAPPASAFRFDVVGLGEISVDEVLLVEGELRWGGKARVGRRERLGGGQVATAMVAARRLGLRTALVGKVGDDEAGRFALDGLRAEGVDVEGVRIVPAETHRATIAVDARGGRTVLYQDDPRLALTADEVAAAPVAAGRVLHVDGSHRGAAIAAARKARAAGCLVSCDLDDPDALDEELLPLIDLCVVSSGFAFRTSASGPRATVDEVHAATVEQLRRRIAPGGVAVATLGMLGAFADDGREHLRELALQVEPLVDTTACGDTFRAGFLAAFLDGREVRACLRFANAAAALKTRDLGRRGCPTRAEVEALLAEPA